MVDHHHLLLHPAAYWHDFLVVDTLKPFITFLEVRAILVDVRHVEDVSSSAAASNQYVE